MNNESEYLLGKLETISNIPTIIVEGHHHVFPYWYNLIKNAVLLHIDHHSDLTDYKIPFKDSSSLKEYTKKLDIGTFICPAVYYGLVNEVIWIEPSNNDKLSKQIGLTYIQELKEEHLAIERVSSGYMEWVDKKRFESTKNHFGDEINSRELINKFRKNKFQWILDIDLDAFAYISYYGSMCRSHATVCDYSWEKRVKETIGLLKKLHRKPDLINISRSQEKIVYIPEKLVDKVQQETICQLKKIYR